MRGVADGAGGEPPGRYADAQMEPMPIEVNYTRVASRPNRRVGISVQSIAQASNDQVLSGSLLDHP